MRKVGLVAPVLAAAFPILFLYAHNVDEVTATSVMPVLLAAVVASMLLTLGLWRAFGNGAQASLTGTVWILLFFLYGHIYDQIAGIELLRISLGIHWFLLPVTLAVAALPLLPTLRRWKRWTDSMPYVTAALAVLVAFNLAAIAMPEVQRLGQTSIRMSAVEGLVPYDFDTTQLPDIYYIVPDRYPSSSTLEEHYGYDNSEFLEDLEDSGFYIADESFANYHETFLSLASSLNMDYLDMLSQEVGEDTSDKTPAYDMLKNHRVWRFLKEQHGYKFIHFGSWWEPTGDNPYADIRINKHPRLLGLVELDNAFYRLLLRTSVLGPFRGFLLKQDSFSQGAAEVQRCRDVKVVDHRHPNDEAEEQCHRTLHTFQQLQEMPDVEGPKFVFVHLLVPHPPFIFGPEGELVEPPPFYYLDQLSDDQIEVLKTSFVDQLAFTNKMLQETIDHILKRSQRPPIIILQADEGPWTFEYIHDDRDEWSVETLRIRHRILNAYYLPGDGGAALYPSISPVNTFRVIFNEYFGAEMPWLEDRAYMSDRPDRLYNFIDITDLVKQEEVRGMIDVRE